MSFFSAFDKFREAGEDVKDDILEKFGTPALSLFSSKELFNFKHHIDIEDNHQNTLYYADSKVFSFKDYTEVHNSEGKEIAQITRKIFSLHQRHFVNMSNGIDFEISSELFHLVKNIINIEGLGWQLRGNFLSLRFELYDQADNIVAVISQKFLSIHDKWCADIYQKEHTDTIVTILITLQHIVRDKENNSSSHNSSHSGNSGNLF